MARRVLNPKACTYIKKRLLPVVAKSRFGTTGGDFGVKFDLLNTNALSSSLGFFAEVEEAGLFSESLSLPAELEATFSPNFFVSNLAKADDLESLS